MVYPGILGLRPVLRRDVLLQLSVDVICEMERNGLRELRLLWRAEFELPVT